MLQWPSRLRCGVITLCALVLAVGVETASARAAVNDRVVLAPFYTALDYTPPPAGSYTLPDLGRAADGQVLDADGRPRALSEYLNDGKAVLLSFFYSTCTDINGCSLATAVLYNIQHTIQAQPLLRDRLRMLSLSFDPLYDTPEVIRLYGNGLGRINHWQFLTTANWTALAPILDDYGQSVIRDVDDQGEPLPSFSHILRVFLIDPGRRIRNIYSVAFLHPELIINDIVTVLADFPADLKATAGALHGPGDDKRGYASPAYRTNSQSLPQRRGQAADLLAPLRQPPLGLPAVPYPADNPVTVRKVALGRKLFFDRRLSLNDTVSCAMCHIPQQGFTSNELATAVGFEGRSMRRNAPSLYNVAYHRRLFHDGREHNLEQQIWGPLLAANEMANPSVGAVLSKLRALPDYQGLFEAAFAGQGPGMENVGKALASYQRTLISANSPFDRWYYGGDAQAVSAQQQRGFELFTGKAGCASCHLVNRHTALFTDDGLHNTGLGYRDSMGIRPAKQRVQAAPGVFLEVDRHLIDAVGQPMTPDRGRYEITQNPADRWQYRTPGLRNVALTAPYMHNGAFSSLRQVIQFYNQGGVPHALLDSRIRPLNLDPADMDALVAFLHSLTGDNVDTLVSDAFAAPIGDITRDDPHWAHQLAPDALH